MAEIYSEAWFGEVRDAMNARVATMRDVPEGTWMIKIEIVGDGRSPYVAEASERHFLASIENGRCAWYREIEGDDPSVQLNYRFRGAATVFDEIAAGLSDPIDVALRGLVKVRGDMRFLMRQAEHVKVLLEAYAGGVETSWQRGRPPYDGDPSETTDA